MGKEQRREPRVRTELEIVITSAQGTRRLTTKNASFKGVFVKTDNPMPLRRLVRVRMEISDGEVDMLGLVAHAVNAANAAEKGDEAGMGLALYPLGQYTGERWRNWIREVYESDPEAHAALVASELPRLRIHLKNQAMKDQFFGQEFPTGEIFYRSPDLLEIGSRVLCEVHHPETGRVLELFADVIDVTTGNRRNRGMQLAFDELSEASLVRVDRFDRGELSEASLE